MGIVDHVYGYQSHLDIADDYSADSVIETMRKFFAIRGCPTKVYSDAGSQLQKAAKIFREWASTKNIDWHEAPAEGQHQNGVSEALIKVTKRSLSHTIGESVLTASGLQMVMFEVANLINARPIGIVTGSDPTQPEPITPNHLLLGRSTPEVVVGPFDNTDNVNRRLRFLNTLVSDWWTRWYDSVLPSLAPSYKWHQRHLNIRVGDICIIKYRNELKGRFRLGRVKQVKAGTDGPVRTITLEYKNPGETSCRKVDRPIHGVAVLVPIEEHSTCNPVAEPFEPVVKLDSTVAGECLDSF